MILTIIVSLLLMIIFVAFLGTILKIFFIDYYPPNTIIMGCQGIGCQSQKCIGENCKCLPCEGDYCQGGFCVGENCKAGDCYGKKCKGGDCYGYGCTPGICHDPECPPEKCPQIIKNCTDGTAKRISYDLFYLKNRKYFPKKSLLNPKLCEKDITLKDIMDGRAEDLDVEMEFNYKNNFYNNNEKIKLLSSKPKIIKNINCDLCIKDKNGLNCKNTYPFVSENGKLLWK